MKKYKLIKTSLVLVLIISIGLSASASIVNINKNNISKTNLFDAQITIYIYQGEGCGCKPIEGATIFASGGDGNDSGVTDVDGKCILTLQILGEYRIRIDVEHYTTVLFDFNVIDDQTFKFHMQAKNTSSTSQNIIQEIIERLLIK